MYFLHFLSSSQLELLHLSPCILVVLELLGLVLRHKQTVVACQQLFHLKISLLRTFISFHTSVSLFRFILRLLFFLQLSVVFVYFFRFFIDFYPVLNVFTICIEKIILANVSDRLPQALRFYGLRLGSGFEMS